MSKANGVSWENQPTSRGAQSRVVSGFAQRNAAPRTAAEIFHARADCKIRPPGVERDRDRAGGLRDVDHRPDAGAPRRVDEVGHRRAQRRIRGTHGLCAKDGHRPQKRTPRRPDPPARRRLSRIRARSRSAALAQARIRLSESLLRKERSFSFHCGPAARRESSSGPRRRSSADRRLQAWPRVRERAARDGGRARRASCPTRVRRRRARAPCKTTRARLRRFSAAGRPNGTGNTPCREGETRPGPSVKSASGLFADGCALNAVFAAPIVGHAASHLPQSPGRTDV